MGLSGSSSAERLSDDGSLSPRELEGLISLFGKSGKKVNFDISKESFCALFKSASIPQFGSKLYDVMKDEGAPMLNFRAFCRAISFACKTTSSNCTRLVFRVFDSAATAPQTADMADGKSSSSTGSGAPEPAPASGDSDFKGFLRFCCEVGETSRGSGFSVSLANVDVLAEKLHRHFEVKAPGGAGTGCGFTVLNNWLNEFFPCTAQLLLTYFNSICFPESISSPSSSFSPFTAPRVAGEATVSNARPKKKQATATEGDPAADSGSGAERKANAEAAELPSILVKNDEILLLGLYSKKLQGSWRLLYSSDKHGMSFNRIAHHLLGYDGPTCVLIRCADEPVETVIGMFSESRWKDSNRFYGTPDNILFTLSPELKIYRASGGSGSGSTSAASGGGGSTSNANTSTNYQYLNLKTYGYPHGFGMGGHLERFRFFIPDTMDEGCRDDKVCVANDSDLTFERGQIVAPSANQGFIGHINDIGTKFNVECLEVWACGGDELIRTGLFAQSKDRDVRAENINKARQCDKAAFAGNAFDQEFLLGKTFEHKTRMADDATQS